MEAAFSGGFTDFAALRMIQWLGQGEGRRLMQPIMEIVGEEAPANRPERKPRRMPVMSANFYPFTVFCWVLSVATVGLIVGFFCTEFLQGYTDLLRTLGSG